MASLLSSFRREKVKMKQSLKTGTEADCSVETESVPSKQNSESEVQETPSASPIPSTSQHSPSGPTRKRKLFLSPKRKLPLKKKSTEDDPRVAYAYDMLKNITETPKNECTTFGEHIATKLAKFKDPVRSVVIYKINNIIFDAEIGKYNNYIDNIGTSVTMFDIHCLEILKVYIKLVYESPVAKNRRVTANLSLTGIHSLKLVFFFFIFGPIRLIINSKSVEDRRQKFLNWPVS
nr:unnamed protein product [Callosobruchus analis]